MVDMRGKLALRSVYIFMMKEMKKFLQNISFIKNRVIYCKDSIMTDSAYKIMIKKTFSYEFKN